MFGCCLKTRNLWRFKKKSLGTISCNAARIHGNIQRTLPTRIFFGTKWRFYLCNKQTAYAMYLVHDFVNINPFYGVKKEDVQASS